MKKYHYATISLPLFIELTRICTPPYSFLAEDVGGEVAETRRILRSGYRVVTVIEAHNVVLLELERTK